MHLFLATRHGRWKSRKILHRFTSKQLYFQSRILQLFLLHWGWKFFSRLRSNSSALWASQLLGLQRTWWTMATHSLCGEYRATFRYESTAGLQRNARHPNQWWSRWKSSWTSEDKRSETRRKCRWHSARNLFPWNPRKAWLTQLLALCLRILAGSVWRLLLETRASQCSPFLASPFAPAHCRSSGNQQSHPGARPTIKVQAWRRSAEERFQVKCTDAWDKSICGSNTTNAAADSTKQRIHRDANIKTMGNKRVHATQW